MSQKIAFKVPGKVVINGSYIVLKGETGNSVCIDRYLRVVASKKSPLKPFTDALPHNTATIKITIQNRESLNCSYHEKWLCDSGDGDINYLLKIVKAFYSTVNVVPVGHIDINMAFDDGFFINDKIKTGIGSSACIVVGIMFCLLHFEEDRYLNLLGNVRFIKSPAFDSAFIDILKNRLCLKEETLCTLDRLLYTINRTLSPLSSGIDVFSCLLGPIQFDQKTIKPFSTPAKYLLLGSLGKSSSTGDLIACVNLKDDKWGKIIKLNNEIINNPTKIAYKEYLEGLYCVDKLIVPEKQFNALKSTFTLDIYGCGISGAGGDDAVWCMVEDPENVSKLWAETFDYVFITKLVDHGLIVESYANKDKIN